MSWRTNYPRGQGPFRRVNEDDLSAADNGNGLGLNGGGLALGLDLTGTASTAQVLSFRAQAAYLHANATSIVVGANNSTALNSTFVGQGAGTNCTGSQNIFMGTNAGAAATTCVRNVGIGFQALQQPTTSSRNVGIGYSALQQLSTGNENTGVGTGALQGLQTGARNCGLGMDVATNADTNDSVMIGHSASSVADKGIALGTGASADAWSLNVLAPIALNFNDSGLVAATPPAGAVATMVGKLRVTLNGTNFVIGLFPDQ